MSGRRIVASLACAAFVIPVVHLTGNVASHAQAGESISTAPVAPARREIPRHPSLLEFPPRVVRVPAPEPFLHQLSDGTRVVIVEDDALPLVRIAAAWQRGVDTPEVNPALGPLTAAMMRRGGTSHHAPDDLDAATDYLGAEMDAATGTDRLAATLDCLASTYQAASELFFEMLREPTFDTARFEQLRGNLLTSFAGRNDDPIEVMERELGWLLFGRASPRSVQLTETDVRALGREDLAAWHRRAWRPDGAVFAVSGAITSGDAVHSLEEQLAHWRLATEPDDRLVSATAPRTQAPPAPEPGLYWAAHPSTQAKVSLALRLEALPAWDARRAAAADLVNEVLGGTGLLSRLGGRLRGGGGLVYRVLSEIELHPGDPGLFRIFLDTGAENLAAALAGTVDEIERLRRDPVPTGELEAVRQELLSRLARRFDSAEEIAGYFAEDILLDRPHKWWSEYLSELRALRPSDVRRTARELLDPTALLVVVVGGPSTAEELHRLPAKQRLVRTWFSEAKVLPVREPLELQPMGSKPGS